MSHNVVPISAGLIPDGFNSNSKFFDDAETQMIESTAVALKRKVESLELECPMDLQIADDLLISLAKKIKRAEERRKCFVGPLNTHVRNINAYYKELSAPLHEADSILRSKVAAYRQEERAKIERQQQELRRLQEAAQREAEEARRRAEMLRQSGLKNTAESMEQKAQQVEAESEQKAAIQPVIQPIAQNTRHTENGSVGYRKVWRHRITDAEKVPREFCSPDLKLIAAAVRSGARNIPGVEIFEDNEIWVRK